MSKPIAFRCIMMLYFALSGSLAVAQEHGYTYVWTPRQTDVGAIGTKDNNILKALLSLCDTQTYSPQKVEGIDFIIRKTFLVSATPFPHAYSLYLSRLRQLNPEWFSNGVVQKGQTIILPSGPTFEASDLSDLVTNVEKPLSTFMNLSGPAFKSKSPQHIKSLAVRTLRYYVSESGQGTDDQIFSAIQDRGLIYAGPSPITQASSQPVGPLPSGSPLLQPIVLRPQGEGGSTQLSVLEQSDPASILPSSMDVPQAQPRVCTRDNCINCRSSMQIPNGIDYSKVKVLVVDTGVQSGYIDADHLIKLNPNDDGRDVSPQSHGTFVYSEIAANQPNTPAAQKLSGVIPGNSIYVAGAATKQGVIISFDASAIVNAWNAFNVKLAGLPPGAGTRVVNLSVFGGQLGSSSAPISFVPPGMLVIAAAGNNESEENPKLQAFARYTNGNVPIIAVGALGVDGQPASYSNYDSQYVQLFAPGDCVCGGPTQIDGTSQAAPFVSVAAATVATSHPDWTPMWVMWRLLSTADHPPSLAHKALAGTVNLTRALDPTIYVERNSQNTITSHYVSSITYDQAWKAAFQASGSNTHNNETLRLYPNGLTQANGAICFTTLNFLSYGFANTCVPKTAVLTITESTGVTSFTAAELNDLILPMPPTMGAEPNLPNVTVSGK